MVETTAGLDDPHMSRSGEHSETSPSPCPAQPGRGGLAFLSSLPLRAAYRLLLLVSPAVRRRQYRRMGARNAVLYYFMQRILRINAHVPWPVHWSSTVICPERIELSYYRPFPGYNAGQYIQAINGIRIGRNVRLGPGVMLISANHDPCDFEKHAPSGPIVIGDNVWLGAGAKVLAGVRIGSHVVVGAGAVVTRDLPGNCVAAGVPARVVKELPEYSGDASC